MDIQKEVRDLASLMSQVSRRMAAIERALMLEVGGAPRRRKDRTMRDRIEALLTGCGTGGMAERDLEEAAGGSRESRTAYQTLCRMARAGLVRKSAGIWYWEWK